DYYCSRPVEKTASPIDH
ncbi:hypothetical protein VCHENC02_5729B, partial [Vibrio harveyi]